VWTEKQTLQGLTGGAAHSNTQGKRDKSRGSSLDCREREYRGRQEAKCGVEETKETEDVTWDSIVVPRLAK